MALSLESVIQYIPEYNGEREAAEKGKNEYPLIFHIKPMGAIPFRIFAAKLATTSEKEPDNALNEKILSLYEEIVSQHVVLIENLKVDDQKIEDGASFCSHCTMPNELVAEIERAILRVSKISEEEAKN